MKITQTKDFAKVTFTWNDELTECNHVALGVTDQELDNLIANKGHEGANGEGWTVTI